jgi:hypothetical protein
MPTKNKKATNTSKRRTKTKALGAARDLSAAETKKVKGGVIAIIAPSAKMGDGSVRPVSVQDGTSNTVLLKQ